MGFGLPEEQRLGFGLIYVTLASSTLFANLLLIFVFCKEDRFYKKYPFYIFSRHLIYCDILMCVIQLYVAVPSTIYSYNIYYEYTSFNFLYNWLTFLDFLASKGTTMLLLLIVVHRLFLFVFPSLEMYCFREFASMIWRIVVWIYILLTTLGSGMFGCTKTFSFEYYYFYWMCVPGTFSQSYAPIIQMEGYVTLLFTFVIMCGIYIYAKVFKRSFQYNKKSRHEKDVLAQTFFLCCSLIICHTIHCILGSWNGELRRPNPYYILAQNTINILMGIANPISFCIFNKKVRNHLRKYFCAKYHRGSKGGFQRPSGYASPAQAPYSNSTQYVQYATPPRKISQQQLQQERRSLSIKSV